MTALSLKGGCDTHVHVVGDSHRYPMLADRRYTPGPASAGDLARHLDCVGMERVVLIQPSIYGTDNRCLIDALSELGPRARAVVVVNRDTSQSELERMDRAGVRGIRLNLESVGDHDCARLQSEMLAWAPRLAGLGWHLQIFAPQEVIAQCVPVMARLAVPCVLDHVAMWRDAGCSGAASQTILAAFGEGNLYIKLSASYRVPMSGPDLSSVVERLAKTRLDRLLWASDWPHTSRKPGAPAQELSPYRSIASEDLVSERNRWLGSGELLQAVCVDNPARLYRF